MFPRNAKPLRTKVGSTRSGTQCLLGGVTKTRKKSILARECAKSDRNRPE